MSRVVSVSAMAAALLLGVGVLVVVDLVNELRMLGVDARIATLRVRESIYKTRLLTQPMAFDNAAALVRDLPATDVLVATHWSTAAWVRDLVDAHRAPLAAYLVQDYEAWFYPEEDVKTRADLALAA